LVTVKRENFPLALGKWHAPSARDEDSVRSIHDAPTGQDARHCCRDHILTMKLRPLVVLAVAVLIGHSDGSSSDGVAVNQAHALFNFYLSTRMFSFRSRRKHNWFQSGLVSDQYCNYTGVTCDQDGYVRSIDLWDKGLTGTLSLGNFTRLRYLRLQSNNIHGPIPAESLTSLQSLRILDLGQNAFSSTIPDMSQIVSLKRLMLFENVLTGSIPTTICNLSGLTHLYLSGNLGMRGTLPACLSNLTQLASLKITNDGLTGTLPSDVCHLLTLNSNVSSCDDIGCSAGYFRAIQANYTNSTRCMPCEVPSNGVASTACMWIGDTMPPSDSPTTVPSMSPSVTPTITASSLAPSAIQAVQESSVPTMTTSTTSQPTPLSATISSISTASNARKRSRTISSVVVAFALMTLVVALAIGARHRSQGHEKIELASVDEETSFDAPFENITSSQNLGLVSRPVSNSNELRSPTSLPFIRPRRSPKSVALPIMRQSDASATTDDENQNEASLGNYHFSFSTTPMGQIVESQLTVQDTTAASTNPSTHHGRTLASSGLSGAARIRSSLKMPAVDTTADADKSKALAELKHVRFSSVGDSIRTFYEESSDNETDPNDDEKLNRLGGTSSANSLSTHPGPKHSSNDEEEADGSTVSTDSIYDWKKPAAQPRHCPMITLFSCGSVPLEGEKASGETKDSDVAGESDGEFPTCLPCSPPSKKVNTTSDMNQLLALNDQSGSINRSRSSSNSSDDEILTSLRVIHEHKFCMEDTKWAKGGLAREDRSFVANRLDHALMDDESTLGSKESTLFSSESDARYPNGPDHAEI
jgi:hypothetical protein